MSESLKLCVCLLCGIAVVSSGALAWIGISPDSGLDDGISEAPRVGELAGPGFNDLVPYDIWTTPDNPVSWQPAMILSQVRNIGLGAYAYSFGNTLYVDGIAVANQTLVSLRAGSTGPEWSATETLGIGYHLLTSIADVANVVVESDETNNELQEITWWASPDLAAASIVTYQYGVRTTNIVPGEPFDAVVLVRNYGDSFAGVSVVELCAIVDSNTTVLGTSPVAAMNASESAQVSFSDLYVNSTGDYIIRAVADSTNLVQEANEVTGSGIGTGETNNACDSSREDLEWLVMVYSPFEPAIAVDEWVLWSQYVGPSSSVKIFIETDQSDNWTGADNSNTRIYELDNYNLFQISDLGELNMGDNASLSDFMIWAMTNYPAQKHLLVLTGHGSGCLGGVGYDSTGDCLDMLELKSSLSTARAETGATIDVVAFDACLMSCFEVAYQISDYARVMVGTEAPAFGVLPYLIFDDLIASPSSDADWLGAMIVSEYESWYFVEMGYGGGPYDETSIAAVNLSTMEDMTLRIETFAQCMADCVPDYRPLIADCEDVTTRFGNYIDLVQFTELVGLSSMPKSPTLQEAIDQIALGMDAAVIAGSFTGTSSYCTGLTITFPWMSLAWPSVQPEYAQLDFSSAAPSWSYFLDSFFSWHKPVASFTYSVDHNVVNFDASASWDQEGIVQYYWDFGDSSVTYSQATPYVTHVYDSGGTYDVTLRVCDTDQLFSDPYTDEVYAAGPNMPPISAMNYEAVDLTVTFNDTSSDPDGYIADVWWDFGDGIYEQGTVVTHVYAQAGTYEVTHMCCDDDGAWASETVNITVEINSRPSVPGMPTITPGDELDGTFTLTWTASVDTDMTPVAGYCLAESANSGDWVNLNENISGTSYTLTRAPGTYTYIVCAFDTADPPLWSEWSQMTCPFIVVPGPPGVPQNLVAVGGNQKIDLSWLAPASDGGTLITSYMIYRGEAHDEETYLSSVLGSQVVYTDSGLTSGKTYYYKVSAVNSVGESDLSNEAFATVPYVPMAPRIVELLPGDTQFYFRWDVPVYDGGSPITEYRLYRGLQEGSEVYQRSFGSEVREFTDTGLTNGLTYYYKLSAVNVAGEGTPGAFWAIPYTTPSAPQNLAAAPGNAQIVLTWSAPASDGGFPVCEYKIYRGLSSGSETYLVSVYPPAMAYTDTGLTIGDRYYYRVTASSAAGEGPYSNEVSAVPEGTATVPGVPQNLAASSVTGGISLTWQAPDSNGGSPITAFKIYKGTRASQIVYLTTVSGSTLTYLDAAVTLNKKYYYQVSAVNSVGEGSRSTTVSCVYTGGPPTVPGAPQNLVASPGNGQITLTWSAPTSNGGSAISAYNVYRGLTSGGETYLAQVSGSTLTYTDAGLTNGVTYYYKVTAVNSVGEGPFSNEASAVPTSASVPTAPLGLTASVSGTAIHLAWSPPASDGGSTITGYKIYRGTKAGQEVYLATVSGSSTFYDDDSVSTGKKYYYKVSAVNAVGEGPMSNEASATVPRTASAVIGVDSSVLVSDSTTDALNLESWFASSSLAKDELVATAGEPLAR